MISDRSFSKLTAVVKEILHESEGLRTFAAIGLGAFASIVLSAFFDFSYLSIFMQCGLGAVAMTAFSVACGTVPIIADCRRPAASLNSTGQNVDFVRRP